MKTLDRKYFFFCDAPPLESKGFGFSVLLFHLLNERPHSIVGFFTFKFYRNLKISEIKSLKFSVSILDGFIPEVILNKLPWKLYKSIMDICFFLQYFKIVHVLKKNEDSDLIFCIGSSPNLIFYSYLIKKLVKNNTSYYIVDDFTEFKMEGWSVSEYFGKRLSKKVLLGANIVTISEGLATKFSQLYKGNPKLLFPVFSEVDKVEIEQKQKGIIHIVFSGGLSVLYNDSLQIFSKALTVINNKQRNYHCNLIIQTYSSKADFDKLVFDTTCVEYHTSETRSSDLPSYRKADFFLVPYSFELSQKAKVSTSFPQKIAELIQLRRPIIFFCPEYSSVYSFLKSNKLDYVISESDLGVLVSSIERVINEQSTNLPATYQEVYNKYFNPKKVNLISVF